MYNKRTEGNMQGRGERGIVSKVQSPGCRQAPDRTKCIRRICWSGLAGQAVSGSEGPDSETIWLSLGGMFRFVDVLFRSWKLRGTRLLISLGMMSEFVRLVVQSVGGCIEAWRGI
jgi:hypothetical protein